MKEIRLKDGGKIRGLKWPVDVILVVEGEATLEDCEFDFYAPPEGW